MPRRPSAIAAVMSRSLSSMAGSLGNRIGPPVRLQPTYRVPVPRLEVPVRPAASWPATLRLLLGDAACDLWPVLLPGRLETLRVTGVTLQPDGAATARYSAAVTRPDGRVTSEVLTATTGRIPGGATTVDVPVD